MVEDPSRLYPSSQVKMTYAPTALSVWVRMPWVGNFRVGHKISKEIEMKFVLLSTLLAETYVHMMEAPLTTVQLLNTRRSQHHEACSPYCT
jgi:hypothetical protein